MTCKDCQNTKEQNIRMRKWFQQRTGLKDTILNNQMKALDKILTKQWTELMSDITLLRKLTRKSMLKFGRYHDYTVQQILDTKGIKGLNTLTWYYFCAEAITFFDDILDELGITKKIRIEKPSNITDWRVVNRCCRNAMFNRIKAEDLLDDEELSKIKGMRRKMYFRDKKDNKFRSGIVSKLISNKRTLQRKNQGKEMEHKTYIR